MIARASRCAARLHAGDAWCSQGRACNAHDDAAFVVLREELQGAQADEEALVEAEVALQGLDVVARRSTRLAPLILQACVRLAQSASQCIVSRACDRRACPPHEPHDQRSRRRAQCCAARKSKVGCRKNDGEGRTLTSCSCSLSRRPRESSAGAVYMPRPRRQTNALGANPLACALTADLRQRCTVGCGQPHVPMSPCLGWRCKSRAGPPGLMCQVASSPGLDGAFVTCNYVRSASHWCAGCR